MMQFQKVWFRDLDWRIDLIPCPHCLNLCSMTNSSSNPLFLPDPINEKHSFPTHYNCHEKVTCPMHHSHMDMTSYMGEFRLILEMIDVGYVYPKQVLKFAQDMNLKK